MSSTPSSKSSTSSKPYYRAEHIAAKLAREDYKALLLDLLAIIHRDGGQFTTLAGLQASLETAEQVVPELFQEHASMKRKVGSMLFGKRKT